MLRVVRLQLSLIGLYLLSYLLWHFHVPYFIYLVGLAIILLPGLNIALTLEQISGVKQGPLKIMLWSLLFCFTITPGVIYIFSVYTGELYSTIPTLVIFALYWFFSFLAFFLSNRWKKAPITQLSLPQYQQHRVFYWGLILGFIILTINLFLYPYLPEVDGYAYLSKLNKLSEIHRIVFEEDRPLFIAFIWTINVLGKISNYWILKAVISYSPLLYIPVLYALVRKNLQSDKLKILVLLSFFSLPMLIQESLYTRPQVFSVTLLMIVLYLLTDLVYSTREWKKLYWFLGILVSLLFAFKIHQTFIFACLIFIITLLVYLKPLIKRYPLESTLIMIYIGFNGYISLSFLNLYPVLRNLIAPFLQILIHPNFRLWFLSGYYDPIGGFVAWPGYSFLFYYGYILGGLIPIIIIFWLTTRLLKTKELKGIFGSHSAIYLLSFFLFFAIAEIFPRLGYSLQPDRGWLFATVSLLPLLPQAIGHLEKNQPKAIANFFLILLVLNVFLVSYYTYYKQGWIKKEEVVAAEFLRNQTPSDSIIISQSSNFPVISYFGQREIAIPKQDFFSLDIKALHNRIKEIRSGKQELDDLESDLEIRKKTISENLEQEFKTSQLNDNLINVDKAIENLLGYKINKLELYKLSQSANDKSSSPVYILYSFNKFEGHYNKYEYWKNMNFYNANLNLLDNHPEYFEKVYDSQGVIIWKVKE